MKMTNEHYSYILSELDTLLDIHETTLEEVKRAMKMTNEHYSYILSELERSNDNDY
jgi:uncharacterized protein YerC